MELPQIIPLTPQPLSAVSKHDDYELDLKLYLPVFALDLQLVIRRVGISKHRRWHSHVWQTSSRESVRQHSAQAGSWLVCGWRRHCLCSGRTTRTTSIHRLGFSMVMALVQYSCILSFLNAALRKQHISGAFHISEMPARRSFCEMYFRFGRGSWGDCKQTCLHFWGCTGYAKICFISVLASHQQLVLFHYPKLNPDLLNPNS